jgi:hypothetical protein
VQSLPLHGRGFFHVTSILLERVRASVCGPPKETSFCFKQRAPPNFSSRRLDTRRGDRESHTITVTPVSARLGAWHSQVDCPAEALCVHRGAPLEDPVRLGRRKATRAHTPTWTPILPVTLPPAPQWDHPTGGLSSCRAASLGKVSVPVLCRCRALCMSRIEKGEPVPSPEQPSTTNLRGGCHVSIRPYHPLTLLGIDAYSAAREAAPCPRSPSRLPPSGIVQRVGDTLRLPYAKDERTSPEYVVLG